MAAQTGGNRRMVNRGDASAQYRAKKYGEGSGKVQPVLPKKNLASVNYGNALDGWATRKGDALVNSFGQPVGGGGRTRRLGKSVSPQARAGKSSGYQRSTGRILTGTPGNRVSRPRKRVI